MVALKKYSIGATQKEIDAIQHLAEILITEIESPNSVSIFRKILTTAKAILWEIDRYKKQSQNTVESLQNVRGLCADLKVDISEEDISQARQEMWGNFPRDII
jgi:hypothetical protein